LDTWTQKQQSTSAPASHASAWVARASASATSSDGQFGRLIFGFAVTEALGIFSLLIALLALFG
jgi:F-type H+-transporting ATPase subunit c